MVLSVRLMVYNNLPFIKETLEGILLQKTNFQFEVVIGDDFSTDGTFEILQDYQKKHPDLIRILDRPLDGQYKKDRAKLGRVHNFVDIVNNCTGKYIAILDGDDYWTDPNKLQKQVDFLEKNKDFSICHHQVFETFEDGSFRITNEDDPEEYDASYLLERGWHIRSVGIVFRKSDLPQWPEWVYSIESMDYATQCLLSKEGQKIKCIKENLANYRIHSNNVSSKINKDYLIILKRNLLLLNFIRRELKSAKFIKIIEARINKTRTDYFYQLRSKSKKTVMDYIQIVVVGFKLKKYKKIFNF